MSLNDQDFDTLVERIKQLSGIVISKDKSYLLESRLQPVIRKHQLENLTALAQSVRGQANSAIVDDMIDAMTTNETLFFRDLNPFNTFRDVIMPKLIEQKADSKTLRVWSAACSTGQEPYSIAMILNDMQAKMEGWRKEILATDLSQEALQKAKSAVYSQFEVQRGMPVQLLMKYFEQHGDKWHLKDEIKNMIKYQKFNLLESPSAFGQFDVIFIRNVLIYFDMDTKRAILDRLAKQMSPKGYLFLGGAETILGLSDVLEAVPEQRGVYRLKGSVEASSSTSAASATQQQQTSYTAS